MTNDVSAGKKMVKTFVVVSPDTKIKNAEAMLIAEKANYCVISTKEGEPRALITGAQLGELPNKELLLADELPNLPVGVPVQRDELLSNIIQHLTPLLFSSRQIIGLIVMNAGDVVGILAREVIREYALNLFNLRGFSSGQIEGNPADSPPTYICPQGDHSEIVAFYDRLNPPTCPTHNILLIRKK